MVKRYWRIEGFKKFERIFAVTIPFGSITEDKLKELLKCLSARADQLPYDEIVGSYVKRKSKLAHSGLQVHGGNSRGYFCGNDPSFVAGIVDEKGKHVETPPLPTVDVTRFL
jgi:hypothetical protein